MFIKKLICIFLIFSLAAPMTVFAAQDKGNLAVNGEFSNGKDPWYVSNVTGSTATYSVGNFGNYGSQCAVISNSSSGRLTQLLAGLVGAKKGDKYAVSAKMKLATPGATAQNDAYLRIGPVFSTAHTVSGDAWTTLSMTYTVPEDITVSSDSTTRFQAYASEKKLEYGAYYVDDVYVYKIVEGSFFEPAKRWDFEETDTDTSEETQKQKIDNSAAEKLAQMTAIKLGTEVAFERGNKIYLGNGVKPVRVEGKVMIPLRTVAEAGTMMVEWDGDSKTATVYDAYYELKCSPGSDYAEVLNFTTRETKTIQLSVPAQTLNGTLMIPLDAFCNTFKKNSMVTEDGLILIGDESIKLTDSEIDKAEEFFEKEIESVSFYVSLDGDDSNSGTQENPFKTLERAKLAAREYRDKNVMIYIAEGEYELSEKLVFEEGDSKLGMARTTFKGEGDVIINGGTIAQQWEKYDVIDGVYKHKLENVKNYSVIYEDGVMAVPARYPNRFEDNVAASYLVMDQDSSSSTNSFLIDGDDFPELANPETADIWMWPGGAQGHWRWYFEKRGIATLDKTTKRVTLESNATAALGKGSSYYVSNDIKLLDVPGEFYIDEEKGYIYYYPRDVKNLENNIVFPTAGGIIRITGTTEAPVSGIEFENLSIRNSDNENLIYMQNIRNIRIEGCRLYSSGLGGIEAKGFVQNNIIRNCEIFDIAERGLNFWTGSAKVNYNKYNRVENNHVHHVGKIDKSGAGIIFRFSASNTIKNNTVHDGPRFLICVSGPSDQVSGETDMSKVYSKNNLVAYNDIYRGMTESQDGGALYSFCTYRNMFISNHVHDCDSLKNSLTDHQIMEGIYHDDITEYTINRYNLVDNINRGAEDNPEAGLVYAGIRQKGAGSLVENNFVVAANLAQGVIGADTVANRAHGSYIYNNIGYTDNASPVYSRLMTTAYEFNIADSDNNIFFNDENVYKMSDSQKISNLQDLRSYKNMGLEENTLTENPEFIDYNGGDYRLSFNSPAYALGTKDLNIKDIGVTNDFVFAEKDEELKSLFVRFDGSTNEKAHKKLGVGETTVLKVSARTKTGYVADLSSAEITYKSDAPQIAEVSASGKITALKIGKANIVVTVSKNGKTLTLPVMVIVGKNITSVKIKNDTTAILKGKTARLESVALDDGGTVGEAVQMTYHSSAPDVIEISENGLMTTKKLGISEITVTANDGIKTVSDKKVFTVIDADAAELNIYMEKNVMKVGSSQEFELWALKTDGRLISLDESNCKITVSDESKARIDGNKIICLKQGKVMIVAELDYYGRKFKKSLAVLGISEDANIDDYRSVEFENSQGETELAFYNINSENMLENGDFSNGLEGWVSYYPQYVSLNNSEGKTYVKIDTPSNSNEEMRDLLQFCTKLEASKARGKKYVAMAKVRVNEGTGRLATVGVYNYRKGVNETHIWPHLHTVGTEWVEIANLFTYNGNHEDGTIPIVGIRSWNDAPKGWCIEYFKIVEIIE